jgi:hypothetical protein
LPPGFIFQNSQNAAGQALPAKEWSGEHTLQLGVRRVNHQRSACYGSYLNVACDGEFYIRRTKRLYIDAMMTLGGVERRLVRIELFDEGNHFRPVR